MVLKELVFSLVFFQWVAMQRLVVLHFTSRAVLLECSRVFWLLQVCSLSSRQQLCCGEEEEEGGERSGRHSSGPAPVLL